MELNALKELEARENKINELTIAYRNFFLNKTPDNETELVNVSNEYMTKYGESDFNCIFEVIKFNVEEDIERALGFVENFFEERL